MPRIDGLISIRNLIFEAMTTGNLLFERISPTPETLPPGRTPGWRRWPGGRWLAGIVARLSVAAGLEVSVGYEDETGFHYGLQPVPVVKAAGRAALFCAVFGGIVAALPLPAFAVQCVTLAWNPSASPNVIGYNVYYGSACGSYTNKISVGNVTSATVPGLQNGACNYFVVTACDALGLESLPSNEVSFTAPARATLALQTAQLDGSSTSITITATGATPSEWVLESSPDLTIWTTVAEGTDPQVNVSVAVAGTPVLFFRLRNDQ